MVWMLFVNASHPSLICGVLHCKSSLSLRLVRAGWFFYFNALFKLNFSGGEKSIFFMLFSMLFNWIFFDAEEHLLTFSENESVSVLIVPWWLGWDFSPFKNGARLEAEADCNSAQTWHQVVSSAYSQWAVICSCHNEKLWNISICTCSFCLSAEGIHAPQPHAIP